MIIEEHLDFQQWEGTNNLKEAHKTQNTVVGRIPRCLTPLLRRNSKSLWFHLLWLTHHNLLHPECQHTEIAVCSCSLYSWSFGWSLPERVVASKIIWKYCEVWNFMTIGPLSIHCPTFFKDPRIRIPSFDEAMREILSYREGKATSTRRRKHRKKRWLWMLKFWICLNVLHRVGIRQDVKFQRERVICFEFCFVLSFDALCTGNECWPKSSLMLGRPIVCNLGTSQCHRCHLVISLFPKMGVTSVASPR